MRIESGHPEASMALNIAASTAGVRSADRANNFNLIRMVAASAVLISHAYPLARGPQAAEPLADTIGISLGTLAVISFFAISGYFISQSFDRSRSVFDFTVARVLRIYPGLIAAVMLAALVLGPLATKLNTWVYFTHADTYWYIPCNLSLFFMQFKLPQVFTDNPLPGAVNGSLWTLFYEVACYAMVACVGISGLAVNGRRFGCFLTLYALTYISIVWLDSYHHILDRSHLLRNGHTFVLPFIVGMSLYRLRHKLSPTFALVSIGVIATILSYRQPWFHEAFVLSWLYLLFYFGFVRFSPLIKYNKVGDYSYGMYIYAFPVEQIGASLFRGCKPIELIAFSFPVTLLLAVLSWHLLEKRALSLRSIMSEWVRRRVGFVHTVRSLCGIRGDIG